MTRVLRTINHSFRCDYYEVGRWILAPESRETLERKNDLGLDDDASPITESAQTRRLSGLRACQRHAIPLRPPFLSSLLSDLELRLPSPDRNFLSSPLPPSLPPPRRWIVRLPSHLRPRNLRIGSLWPRISGEDTKNPRKNSRNFRFPVGNWRPS